MADKQAYSTVSVRLTAEEKKELENYCADCLSGAYHGKICIERHAKRRPESIRIREGKQ